MGAKDVFVLGGFQTDFAENFSKKGLGLFEIMSKTVDGALASCAIEPAEIEVAHVANFTGELFNRQAQLGGFFASLHPEFDGLPTSRHEAACASGGVAVLAAAADLEAGRHDLACVVGVEQERNIPGKEAAEYLGVASWPGREAQDANYPWPYLFSALADEYDQRYGLSRRALAGIAEINFGNAKSNPNAQTRGWKFEPQSFLEDEEKNPVVEGRIRRQDCSQMTDGGAAIFLASARFAEKYAARRGLSLDRIPRILGYGHRTAPTLFEEKMKRSRGGDYVFPSVRRAIGDALSRAGLSSAFELSGIETHDCFTITEYMAIDHFGLTAPGRSFEAIESGVIARDGKLPVNPSGGLMGGGHPVGASGVRMVLDAALQTSGRAGGYQIPGARRFGVLNIGGTATTAVSFVVGC